MTRVPWQDAPLFGPWLGRIGMARDIIADTCSPTPSIWVQAFFYGAAKGFVHAIKPTPTDYALLRRPKGSPGHGRRRRFNADVFAVVDGVTPPPGELGWAMFDMTSAVNTLAALEWYLTIADAATDALLWWTTLAMKWSGCPGAAQGYATGHLAHDSEPIVGSVVEWLIDSQHVCSWLSTTGISVPGGVDYSVGYSISWKPSLISPTHEPSVQTILMDLASGEQFGFAETKPGTRNGMTTAFQTGWRKAKPTGHTFVVIAESDTAFPRVSFGSFSASSGDPHSGLNPDP